MSLVEEPVLRNTNGAWAGPARFVTVTGLTLNDQHLAFHHSSVLARVGLLHQLTVWVEKLGQRTPPFLFVTDFLDDILQFLVQTDLVSAVVKLLKFDHAVADLVSAFVKDEFDIAAHFKG